MFNANDLSKRPVRMVGVWMRGSPSPMSTLREVYAIWVYLCHKEITMPLVDVKTFSCRMSLQGGELAQW